jgi:ABC-type multidrug transport system fused ATPase/permease subunit
MEAMGRLMQNRTSFMIAHRVGTLDTCDMLLEVREGHVRRIERADLLTPSLEEIRQLRT